MTKQEKIKEAYGEDYKFINEFLIGNGFFDGECDDFIHLRRKLYKNGGIDIKIIDEVQFVRPKSLEGIEHNNNWIKIEDEDCMPYFDFEDLWVFIGDKVKLYSEVVKLRNLESGYFETDITHYHPIEKPKPPIY